MADEDRSREELLYLARLAEQCDRFDGKYKLFLICSSIERPLKFANYYISNNKIEYLRRYYLVVRGCNSNFS